MKNENNFADIIYKIRKRNKITQKQFADHLGLNQATISAWELGKQYPHPGDFKVLEEIANKFDVNFDFLSENLKLSLEYRQPSTSTSGELRINDPYLVPIIERLERIYSKIDTENKYKLMLNFMNNLEALASDYIPSIKDDKENYKILDLEMLKIDENKND